MNASYKIVLLGAFVLFAAVIGYYVLSGSGGEQADEKPAGTGLAKNTPASGDPGPADSTADEPEKTPPSRPGILDPEPVRPGLSRERTPGEVTIDVPDEDETDTPTATPGAGEGTGPASDPDNRLALDDRPGPGETERPGPGTTEDVTTTDDRPGPDTSGTETADIADDTTTPDPAETERPAPRETAGTPRTYTVKPGDTFASIAVAVYGEERAWFDIAQANPSVDPKRLQVDQVIVLPDLSGGATEPEEATPPAPGNDQTYTVRPGDNLSGIAEKFYGDSEAWDLIYNRNRDKIGPRPDMIKVGMELIIPQAYNGAD